MSVATVTMSVMSTDFFGAPILNSPYEYPRRHWELDSSGQPTRKIVDARRPAEFITPIPMPKKQRARGRQAALVLDEGLGLSTEEQQYDPTSMINGVRREVDRWRAIPDPSKWRVTPETARLLQHWRHHRFEHIRPFFCQLEAVETAIWITEVAPRSGRVGRDFSEHLERANNHANPDLPRLALKMATGSGKTTVMAMLIAWQTVNAVRRPQNPKFTRGFLVVAPGIAIRDRLRVLQPNDPDSYYRSRELIPGDLLIDLEKARIVITNYHAFKLRERVKLTRGARSLLQGRGEELKTLESEGQMLQRVMPELLGLKRVLVLNDEAHHCYREKPGESEESKLTVDDRKEARDNQEAARLWISGLESVGRKLDMTRVIDLSATPFFLRGSGYAEGTLFPWTMSDFSLMDADLHMAGDLKNTGTGNLFVIFGEPDIEVLDADDDQIQVKIHGVDVYRPNTGEIQSDNADGIACWFIDTDYNEESFFVRHAYFLGANDPYKALKTTLKAEINREAWETLRSDISRPFYRPSTGRIAVKVINHLGDEVMKVFRV